MPVTKSARATVSGLQVYKQTNTTSTADNNITGAATTLYAVSVDNTANPAQTVYLKLYDAASPTVGTTVPAFIFMIPGGYSRIRFSKGMAFATALSWACVTAPGTAGTTSPTAAVVTTAYATP